MLEGSLLGPDVPEPLRADDSRARAFQKFDGAVGRAAVDREDLPRVFAAPGDKGANGVEDAGSIGFPSC